MALDGIEGLLHSIFLVLAIKAGNHWELSEAEATQLSKAVANVARHYPVAKTQKAADWSQLAVVIAVLGVPRAVESWQMKPAAPGLGHNGGPPLGPPPGPAARPAATPAAGLSIQTPSQLDPGAMMASHLTSGRA